MELGELTLVSDQPVTVSPNRESATPEAMAASPGAAAWETTLSPGESALASDDTTLSGRNDTPQSATFLALMMFSGAWEVEAAASSKEGSESAETVLEPVGLISQGISVANAEFPAVPGTVTIERIEVAAGETLESQPTVVLGVVGLELGAVEQGSARMTLATRSGWLWPNLLSRNWQERQPIALTASTDVTEGDAYSIANGWSSWIVTSATPLIMLRVVITAEG